MWLTVSILIVLIIFMIFYKCKIGNNKDYLSYRQTTAINGCFIILVFFRHLTEYASFNGILDIPMNLIDKYMSQLIVVMFLFNSGYGIMESIKNKDNYINTIPKKRIFNTWLQFALCVFIYMIVRLAMEADLSIESTLLSFVGWKSIGNSNWYIFVMLFMWLFTWVSFKILKNNYKKSLVMMTFLSIIFSIILMISGKDGYWYNTILCYPFGMFYSIYKDKIDNYIKRYKTNWIKIFILTIVLFGIFSFLLIKNPDFILAYEIESILFAIIIVMCSMKIKINNNLAYWFGQNLFGLYMLQRIPMILLEGEQLNSYVYALLCFMLMIILGYLFNKLYQKTIQKKIIST